jgi:hypothetical protein
MRGGTAVVAARGRKPGGTVGAGRLATGGLKARRDLRCWPVGCRRRGTCSGEVGPNGENYGTRFTKKIQVS